MHFIPKILLIAALGLISIPSDGFADWTKWERIKKLQRVGKSLAKAGRVPVAIQCKRGPGRIYFNNALFRLKTVPKKQFRIHIRKWTVNISNWGVCNWPKQDLGNLIIKSCSKLPPTPSGVRATCSLTYLK